MNTRDDHVGVARAQVLGVFFALGLLFLVGALWRTQVRSGARYVQSVERQSLRRVRAPASRGRILDRHGVCLAGNRPSYCICVRLEAFRVPGRWERTAKAVYEAAQEMEFFIGRPPAVTESAIMTHIRRQLPMPLVLAEDLDDRSLARFVENQWRFRGMEIVVMPARDYPQGLAAAHVLGYVGRTDLAPEERSEYDYLVPEFSGRAGLEAKLDRLLAGVAGREVVRVDASGFRHVVEEEARPIPGRDVVLTLDLRVQQLAEEALADGPGAIVVLDPRNGDVLAMASRPTFSPADFVPSIPTALWREMTAEEAGKPLINRAVDEIYAPGSLFKALVAVTALETGRGSPATTFDCPGYFALGASRFRCWNVNGHGTLAMRKAIEQSCNSYFCALGLQCGLAAIRDTAAGVGLGRPTGIELPHEEAGVLPDDAWKRARYREGWRDGDTCNVSIGQGFLAVTPLQMAVVAAALANGGRVYRPAIVRGIGARPGEAFRLRPPVLERDLGWSPRTMETVRGGMRDVIEAPAGTGARARIDGVEMAGKTGTAEFGVKGGGLKHAWMMLFAPVEDPRYAVVMVVDEGVSGGTSVAPRLGGLMRNLFALGEAQG